MRPMAVRVAMAVLALLACLPSTAHAQTSTFTPSPSNNGNIMLSGAFDFANAYFFRGLRQDDTRLIMWPSADAGIRLFSGRTGAMQGAELHIGTWNSLNTGFSGSQGPSGKAWYESDFYATLGLTFGPGLNVGSTYTAYTSPNNSFSTVKELSFKVSADDSSTAPGAVLNPWALVAFELDTLPGLGQADGGLNSGNYLELGIAPGWQDAPFSITLPIKVGLSLKNYYELAGVDHQFGFLSLGGHVQLPIGRATDYGQWNVHGGVDFYSLGDTPEAFNAGDQQKLIGSIGIGFSY